MPHGYGKVCVSFGSSGRNVTQADKDAATLRVYFNGLPVEKKDGVFEKLVAVGTRLSVTAEAVSTDGKIIGKGEESITVKSGSNNVPVKIYTYDNFIVTIDGKATGYTTFTDAWDAANGKTATIKMNADATNVVVTLASPGNVTLDLNGHTITGRGSDYVFLIGGRTFTLTGNGTVKQPANANAGVIRVGNTGKSIFNMYGGTITGGMANSGGGVFIYMQSEFNMYGGSIIHNAATSDGGGGVFINPAAKFNMNGGVISNNTSEDTGGGVRAHDGANGTTFNWNGGTISGNTATSGNNVYVTQYAIYTRNGETQDTLQDVSVD